LIFIPLYFFIDKLFTSGKKVNGSSNILLSGYAILDQALYNINRKRLSLNPYYAIENLFHL